MPAPDPIRDSVLKYLRFRYPYGEQLLLRDGRCYAYEDVKAAVSKLAADLPDDFMRVLVCFAWEPWERVTISAEVDFDSSTVKRKLDMIADMLMEHLDDAPNNHVFEGPKAKLLRTSQLAGLRKAIIHNTPWVLWDGTVVPVETWRAALKNLEENAPEYVRVLHMYARKLQGGRLNPVAKVAKTLVNDSSTIRRKLHVSVDMVVQHLRNREVLNRPHLFPIRDEDCRVVGHRAWPFHLAWSQLKKPEGRRCA